MIALDTRPTVVHDSTLGPITLSASDRGLTRVRFGRRTDAGRPAVDGPARALLERAVAEIDEYLLGRRVRFTVPVDLSRVEPAHRAVLDALGHVGYGTTCSYTELARTVGFTEDGPRRAAAGCARNPVLLFVPCHRVVAVDGRLTGYSGGLPVKAALLALERGQLPLALG